MVYKTFYTDKFVQKNHVASTRGCFIFIRPQYKDDFGLHEHEKVHVAQFWRLPVIHSILYFLSKEYRLTCEVDAYKEQLKYCDDSVAAKEQFASFIATKYNLNISKEEAEKLL